MITLVDGWPQFINDNGNPVHGRVSFYSADSGAASTNFKNVYADPSNTTLAANPNYLDASGKTSTQIFLGNGLYYVVVEKFLLDDDADMASYADDSTAWSICKSFYVSGSLSEMTMSNLLVSDIASLRSISASDGAFCIVNGYYSNGDCSARIFRYDASSTATEDGVSIFTPSNLVGRWIWTPTPIIEAEWGGVDSSKSATVNNAAMIQLSSFCISNSNVIHAVAFKGSGIYNLGHSTESSNIDADFGWVKLYMKTASFKVQYGQYFSIRCGEVLADAVPFYNSTTENSPYVTVLSGTIHTSWFKPDMTSWINSTPDTIIVDGNISHATLSNPVIKNCSMIYDGGQFMSPKAITFKNVRFQFNTSNPIMSPAYLSYDPIDTWIFTNCYDIRSSEISKTGITSTVLNASTGTHFIIDNRLKMTSIVDDTTKQQVTIDQNGWVNGSSTAYLKITQNSGFGTGRLSYVLYGIYGSNHPDVYEAKYYQNLYSCIFSAELAGATKIDLNGHTWQTVPHTDLTLMNGTCIGIDSTTASTMGLSVPHSLHLENVNYTISSWDSSTRGDIIAVKDSVINYLSAPTTSFGACTLDKSQFTINWVNADTSVTVYQGNRYFDFTSITMTNYSEFTSSNLVKCDGDAYIVDSKFTINYAAPSSDYDGTCGLMGSGNIYIDDGEVNANSVRNSVNYPGFIASTGNCTACNSSKVFGYFGWSNGVVPIYVYNSAEPTYPALSYPEVEDVITTVQNSEVYNVTGVQAIVTGSTIDKDVISGFANITGNIIKGDVHLQCQKAYQYTKDYISTLGTAPTTVTFRHCISGNVSNNKIGGGARSVKRGTTWSPGDIDLSNYESTLAGMLYIEGSAVSSDNNFKVSQGVGDYCVIDLVVTDNSFLGYDLYPDYVTNQVLTYEVNKDSVSNWYAYTLNGSITSRGAFDYKPYPISLGITGKANSNNVTYDQENLNIVCGTRSIGNPSNLNSMNKMIIRDNNGPLGCARTHDYIRINGNTAMVNLPCTLFRLAGEDTSSLNVTGTAGSFGFANVTNNSVFYHDGTVSIPYTIYGYDNGEFTFGPSSNA